VSLDHLTLALSLNESWARSLSHVTCVRVRQRCDLPLGERLSHSERNLRAHYNSSAISAVLGIRAYVAAIFRPVSYEDLGLSLKAKPAIHGNGDVSLTLELQVRSLTGQKRERLCLCFEFRNTKPA